MTARLEVAGWNNATFCNVNVDDVVLYPSTVTQKVMIGCLSNSVAGITVLNNNGFNSVGINKGNPAYTLDVAGQVNACNLFINGQAINNSPWGTNANGVIVMGTNVGINTTTPAFTLDVAGIVNASNLYVNGAPYIGSQWTTSANASNVFINSSNVGIGTSTPSQLLHVNGNTLVNGRVRANAFSINEDTTSGVPSWDGMVIYESPNFFGGNSECFMFEKTDFNSLMPDGAMAFSRRGSDGITNVDLMIRNGRIGIGTSNPAQLCHIEGSAYIHNTLAFQNLNRNQIISLWGGASATPTTETNFYGFGVNSSVLRYQAPASADHVWFAGATEVMRINVGGNLWVSNTLNAKGLHFRGVTGDASSNHTFIVERLYDSAGASNPTNDSSELLLAKFNDTNIDRIRHVAAAHKWQVYNTNQLNYDPTNQNMADSNYINAMFIASNGNVAIKPTGVMPTVSFGLDVNDNARVIGNIANTPDLTVNDVLVKSYVRTLATTVGSFTNICTLTATHGALTVELNVVHSEANSSEAKTYKVALFWTTNTAYFNLLPISSSGAYGTNDWNVQAAFNSATNLWTLRLVRVGGTTSTTGFTCSLIICQSDVNKVTIGDSATTGTGANTITAIYASTQLTQVNSNVGIGLLTPTFKLHVSGDIYATGNVTAYSDCNYKSDITYIDGALEKVSSIGGYTFTFTEDETKKRYAGVLAQEVEQVLPEVVMHDGDGKKGVAYGNISALLINAIKELREEVQELKAENQQFRQELDTIKARLSQPSSL
jgi:hypothetical protein